MKAAPAFDCAVCKRTIGKTATHCLTDDKRVLCKRCAWGKNAHAKLYPDCPVRWHDAYDHDSCTGSRAGIAAHLGLWP